MDKNKDNQISWLAAARELLRLSNKKGIQGLKGYLFFAALTWPLVFYLSHIKNSEMLSGAVPPTAPTIRITGYLSRKIEKQKIKETAYYELTTDNMNIYKIPLETAFHGAEKLAATTPPKRIYAEGFFLKNGSGAFWFTSVKLENGRTLLTPSQSTKQLYRQKNEITWYVYTLIFLWSISLFNLYKIKTNQPIKK